MKNYNCYRIRIKAPGFALVCSLFILALVLLVAVGTLSLATIEVRSTQNQAAMLEARANARTALMLACGQLQESMGPDKRISARAELLAKDKRLNATVSAGTPKAFWVGVSSSDRTQSATSYGNTPVIWLVSGIDPQATPAEQISAAEAFDDPVTMFGDQSIDTAALTGGRPIEAGKVKIIGDSSHRPGKIAWFIDDNGLKAQLAASRPEVNNEQEEPYGQGIIPGTYDLSTLVGMDGLAGNSPAQINRLLSISDLRFLGAPEAVVRGKRMGYTTRSRGVLSDVKNGGLKKDLTIAFENEDVFKDVFGDGVGFPSKYIMMDPQKFQQSSDLQANGYIHWEMLKDYYNIKQYIKTGAQGMESIPISVFRNNGLRYSENSDNNFPFMYGQLGPHQIGDNAQTPVTQRQMPYGDYGKLSNSRGQGILEPVEYYKHSPVVPILQRMQQNAWLERTDVGGIPHVRTNVQIWMAQYNPYNIGLDNRGPYARGYSQVDFDHKGLWVERAPGGTQEWLTRFYKGFLGRTQVTSSDPVMLAPGRSHVMAIQKDSNNVTEVNQGYYLSGTFGENVKYLTMESSLQDYRLFPDQCKPDTLTYTFDLAVNSGQAIIHGGDSGGFNPGNLGSDTRFWTVSQMLWAPYSYDSLGTKKIRYNNVSLDDLNENLMGRFAFSLRTTQEPQTGGDPAIRPLVDANMRACLLNGRWDSPLGLNLLAAYSTEGQGEVDDQIMQMDVRDDPKGYAYWGAGRDPVDGYDRVILFDIPRKDLVSIGQLQHANVGRFSYEPTYVIGNSYANLRIPQDRWKASVSDTLGARKSSSRVIQGNFNLYDASYLVNEVLWDSSVFTTIPQIANNYNDSSEAEPTDEYFELLRKGGALLANPRFLPYVPAGSKFDLATLQQNPQAIRHNAGHVMIDGAFNVNSTSVDAWEAFLSSTNGLPTLMIDSKGAITGFRDDVEGVRFPRVHASIGSPMEKDAIDENYWTGFRSLSKTEVRELAAEIVVEIKKRGPFLTMGEFVNRKLEDGELGQRGALQAALDNTVNKDIDTNISADTNHPDIPTGNTQGIGFPGQLLQGDILQTLSPFMTVRSDTFTIRAYGETLSPDGSKVIARAWCEATLQRYPDPVPDPAVGDALTKLANPTSPLGRVFHITSFRWLNENEI